MASCCERTIHFAHRWMFRFSNCSVRGRWRQWSMLCWISNGTQQGNSMAADAWTKQKMNHLPRTTCDLMKHKSIGSPIKNSGCRMHEGGLVLVRQHCETLVCNA